MRVTHTLARGNVMLLVRLAAPQLIRDASMPPPSGPATTGARSGGYAVPDVITFTARRDAVGNGFARRVRQRVCHHLWRLVRRALARVFAFGMWGAHTDTHTRARNAGNVAC